MDRSLVARATSSDDSPTPGYLYGDIAQMTHANFEGCRQLTVYLLDRLKKPNHNTKFKCLQIIKVSKHTSTASLQQAEGEGYVAVHCCCMGDARSTLDVLV